jgi:hypothetical protein
VAAPATGENVRTIQYQLNAQGASLAVDGIFGPLTTAAVQNFQSTHGLLSDGIVGNRTWPALLLQVASGANGAAVRALQSQMNSRIANLLVLDGLFGPRTDALVRSFQGPCGLVVDGIVGPNTWHAIVTGFLTAPSAQDATRRVFHAWTLADPAAAAKDATADAVAQLFARAFAATDGWAFDHCEGAAGSVGCIWNRPGEHLILLANNNAGAPFFYVTNVTFRP